MAFQPTGLIIRRDVREIGYKDSIKDFMNQLHSTDFVLLIISDSFLKSSNAMFEVLELLKESDFKDKILPIIEDKTKVFKPEDRLVYIKYWANQYEELEKKLQSVNTTDAIELYKELKHYEKIRTSIDEFLSILTGMHCPTYSALAVDNFRRIFDYIGVSDKVLINEILSLREFVTEEEQDIEVDQLEAKYPNNAKIYFVKADYAFRRNHISKSNYFYKKSIELDPSFGASYYNLGFNVEVHDKDFEEAKRLYEKAIELEPTNTRAYSNLAGLYSTVFENPSEARKLLEAALKINPYDAVTNYNLALVLHRDFNDFENAKDHYETAIMINEDFADAIHNYGMILYKHFKLYSKSKDQFLKVLELEPDNKQTLRELAILMEDEYKHYSTAKIYWDRFIKIEPNTAEDHYLYAMFLILYFESTEKGLARKHYDIACSMDGSFKSEQAEILLS